MPATSTSRIFRRWAMTEPFVLEAASVVVPIDAECPSDWDAAALVVATFPLIVALRVPASWLAMRRSCAITEPVDVAAASVGVPRAVALAELLVSCAAPAGSGRDVADTACVPLGVDVTVPWIVRVPASFPKIPFRIAMIDPLPVVQAASPTAPSAALEIGTALARSCVSVRPPVVTVMPACSAESTAARVICVASGLSPARIDASAACVASSSTFIGFAVVPTGVSLPGVPSTSLTAW
jgi:hypothetical protein